MVDESPLRGVIEFFGDVGLYDVVLPFLLVFTIVFAILEKTRVLGEEMIDNKKYSRKNLNTMAAFVIAFLVVASSQLVEIISTVSSQMVVLLMLAVLFLLLVGSFYKEGEFDMSKGWKFFFAIIMFIGIVLIFLNAITYEGSSWLNIFWSWVSGNNASNAVGSIVLLILIVLCVWFIVTERDKGASNSAESSK